MWIILFSEGTPFENSVSTSLSPIEGCLGFRVVSSVIFATIDPKSNQYFVVDIAVYRGVLGTVLSGSSSVNTKNF